MVVVDDKETREFAIKRIVALPGETIAIENGQVILNGTPIEEAYLRSGMTTHAGAILGRTLEILDKHYFILGDNRVNSADSRYYGPVHLDSIVGVVPEPKKVHAASRR